MPPTQLVAVAGVMLQVGFGTQAWIAVHGPPVQPLASVTLAVKVQTPGASQLCVMFVEPFCAAIVTVRLTQPLSTTV